MDDVNRIGVPLRTSGVTTVDDRSGTHTAPDPRRARSASRGSWAAVGVWGAVIGAGVLALVATGDLVSVATEAPPLHGGWDLRPGLSMLPAVACAVALVAVWPRACATLRWRAVMVGSTGVALAWGVSLALVDGGRGLVGPAQNPREYLAGVRTLGSPARFLRDFPDAIRHSSVHVQGHPPGYPLVVWVIDRLGFGAWGVTVVQVVGGALAVPAVLLAVRAVADESFARRAAPFVAVSPAAIWLVSSADAAFAGVGAWAVTAVVLACVQSRGRRRDALAVAGGALLGVAAVLSYGLTLLAVVPLGVAWRRRAVRPLVLATVGGAAVFLAFAVAGFWWFDGLAATQREYVSGIASRRPYEVFVLANLAALAIATGPAVAVGLARLRGARVAWLVGGAVAAVMLANLSGMSKGEVERIWLPFAVWLLPAAGAVSARGEPRIVRRWLAAQCALALFVQVGVRTPW